MIKDKNCGNLGPSKAFLDVLIDGGCAKLHPC